MATQMERTAVAAAILAFLFLVISLFAEPHLRLTAHRYDYQDAVNRSREEERDGGDNGSEMSQESNYEYEMSDGEAGVSTQGKVCCVWCLVVEFH